MKNRMVQIGAAAAIMAITVLPASAAVRYVDNGLASDCAGNYSIANRACNGVDGTAYRTVQAAVDAMNVGDTIYLRGGTPYFGAVNIPLSKNGSAWTAGNYNTIASFPGEWAILDGQNAVSGPVLGHYTPGDTNDISDIKYWLIERLEIRNGRFADGSSARGFQGNGGPFKIRYCYIHDNTASSGTNNPYGAGGQHWRDSVVEYSYFKDNGMTTPSTDTNPAHIAIYTDYNWTAIAVNGFNPAVTDPLAPWRNTIRYNYLTGGNVGFKHKGRQYFTGRTTTSPWADTYSSYGDSIHHNIVVSTRAIGIEADMDFAQVHNNIIDTGLGTGIAIEYQVTNPPDYKVVVANNTVIGAEIGIVFYSGALYTNELYDVYGFVYNNITDSIKTYAGGCSYTNISQCEASSRSYSLGNWYVDKNYVYRPANANIVNFHRTNYTKTAFEAQTVTHAPRGIYSNAYNASDQLYVGSSGADKYRTRGAHVLEGTSTIANGGCGLPHPYLAGKVLPGYVGASNPSDNAWIAGVLSLSSSVILSAGTGSDPAWIEGATRAKAPSKNTLNKRTPP